MCGGTNAMVTEASEAVPHEAVYFGMLNFQTPSTALAINGTD
jgi:hypothetical protein